MSTGAGGSRTPPRKAAPGRTAEAKATPQNAAQKRPSATSSGRVRIAVTNASGALKRITGRDAKPPLSRREKRRRRNRRAAFTIGGATLFVAAFTGGLLAAPVDLTSPPPPKSAVLLDDTGKPIASIQSPEAREEVSADKIPAVMRDAIIAAEDERFLKHGGVDPIAIIRATIKDITGSSTQGGSTITQQYIKNTFVGSERTVLRKIKEAALAIRLEHQVPKETILTRYLNSLYLGQGTYGVQAASKYYYGKDVSKIDLAQAAMLAGIAPAPSRYNPVVNYKLARERQYYTLNRMIANKMITSQEASKAFLEQIDIKKKLAPAVATIAPEFADYVEQDLKQRFAGDEDALFRGGLRVKTTLDLNLQQAVVDALKKVLPNRLDPEAAVVAIDPRTGDIKAMATKRDNGYKRGGLNLATSAYRNSGSTVKPFTLAAALENGHTVDEVKYGPPCTTIQVSPPYHFCNAEDGEGGSYSLKTALALSVNTIYAPLAWEVGTSKVRTILDKTGWKAPSVAVHNNWIYASMGLGVEASPISVVHGYATLANHGVNLPIRAITEIRTGASGTDDGTATFSAPKPKGTRAMPNAIADQVIEAMKGVVQYGTGTAARVAIPVAGKTGTGETLTNAWFVGCTQPDAASVQAAGVIGVLTRPLCIGVWMGYDNPKPMRNVEGYGEVFGGTLPALIFSQAIKGYQTATRPVIPTPTVSSGTSPTPIATATAPGETATPISTPTASTEPTPSDTPVDSPTPTPTDTVIIEPSPSSTPPIQFPNVHRRAAPW